MKNTGTLRIQAFAARQSSPVEGVTVTVSGNGFTATRLTLRGRFLRTDFADE